MTLLFAMVGTKYEKLAGPLSCTKVMMAFDVNCRNTPLARDWLPLAVTEPAMLPELMVFSDMSKVTVLWAVLRPSSATSCLS